MFHCKSVAQVPGGAGAYNTTGCDGSGPGNIGQQPGGSGSGGGVMDPVLPDRPESAKCQTNEDPGLLISCSGFYKDTAILNIYSGNTPAANEHISYVNWLAGMGCAISMVELCDCIGIRSASSISGATSNPTCTCCTDSSDILLLRNI